MRMRKEEEIVKINENSTYNRHERKKERSNHI